MQFLTELFWLCLFSAPILCLNNDREYWYLKSKETLQRRLESLASKEYAPLQVARNVVVFIGDGMSLTTLTAARILKGQRSGGHGEESRLVWEEFPSVALAQTYNADAQIGESSACATALWCGVKANYETVGLDASAKFGNCASSFDARVPSILRWAQQQGKTTGIVTTTRVSHATPASLYAHAPSRYWEDDAKIPPASRRRCKDIVRQLVEDEPGRNINVVLGGGRRHWFSMGTSDPEDEKQEGRRLDGRNLITEWIRERKHNQIEAEYVWNKEQLDKVDPTKIDQLLGIFSYSHMDFEADRDNKTEPSLAEMTKKALSILMKNPWGYFLAVEGGRIDHAHHYNNAYRALDETLALEEAVAAVLQEVDLSETLVIVTADHSHVMTFGGHGTQRGNPVFGYDSKVSDLDDLPYTTILYGNGPGYGLTRHTEVNTEKDTIQSAAVPRFWATHGGEDVPVYATGPLAALFSGSFDQTYIPHAISYIACLGHFKDRCGCLYFGCETEVLSKPCENGNCTEAELDNLIMISDQEVLSQMRLVSSAPAHHCNMTVYMFVVICVFLIIIK